MEELSWKIVFEASELNAILESWGEGLIACDTETYGKVWLQQERKLLGISLSPIKAPTQGIYVPLWAPRCQRVADVECAKVLQAFFQKTPLVGHNFTYDWRWLFEHHFHTRWVADTRLMWHLSAAPAGPFQYKLKQGQVNILKWPVSNDKELEEAVRQWGGSTKNGDHYLADVEVLGKYAALDAISTAQLYNKFTPYFDAYEYWWMLELMMRYNRLLEQNTYRGVPVDRGGLKKALTRAHNASEKAQRMLSRALVHPITELEKDWVDRKVASYKRESNKEKYLAAPKKWRRFKWENRTDKIELFYEQLKYPVLYHTETGQPQVTKEAVQAFNRPWGAFYEQYADSNYLVNNFIKPYLECSEDDGHLHPGYNITGTVSYRLSGFKPYFLNAPFSVSYLMRTIHCPEGYTGVHADLWSIEPAMTAHFSQDEALLRVFRDLKGDIYLEIAGDMFPNDEKYKKLYNPNVPITEEVKEALKHVRKPAKIVHLAAQYGGTEHTIAKTLTSSGIPTQPEEAKWLVKAYWQKFWAVKNLEILLRRRFRKTGVLENVIGRRIRVPDPDYKDILNRFIQSSAHDCLVLWVLEIDKLRKERNINMHPALIDCHDSTSWYVKTEQKKEGKKIFQDALTSVNKKLKLSVEIRADVKYFKTFAGLKDNEEY